ncbi:unannotated protein [freshwater metagenome]|uniref:Unannotated protein n=1 Tax=freshwater metagenome TaxID=449393 RepID=A0A6J6G2K5_9ZZZZ
MHTSEQDLVGDCEGFGRGDSPVGDVQQTVIGDNDERIDFAPQTSNSDVGLFATTACFKPERFCHDTNCECANGFCDSSNDRRTACSRSSTFTSCDKHEVSAGEALFDFLGVILRCVATDFGVSPSTKATGELSADVELDVSIAHEQRLSVGVDCDELNSANTCVNHSIHGVDSAAADTDYLDDGKVIVAAGSHGNPPTFRLHLKLRLSAPREAPTS